MLPTRNKLYYFSDSYEWFYFNNNNNNNNHIKEKKVSKMSVFLKIKINLLNLEKQKNALRAVSKIN